MVIVIALEGPFVFVVWGACGPAGGHPAGERASSSRRGPGLPGRAAPLRGWPCPLPETEISEPLAAQQATLLELGKIRYHETDLAGVLSRVATLARQTLAGVAEVSVTLVDGGRPSTAAFTGELALLLDESQYDEGFGPCLDVAQSSGAVHVADMRTEQRWPAFTALAVRHGVLSSLSLALPIQDSVVGALNVYATTADAFDEATVALAATFADYAAVAVANAHLTVTTAALADNLRLAMETRSVIEQAKGILMAQQRCTAERAFEVLTKLSQHANRKLRDVAADVVASVLRTPGAGEAGVTPGG